MTRRIILWGLAFTVSLYLGMIFFMLKNQRVLQYTPGQLFLSLDEVDLPGARLVNIPIDDLINVRGWYIPPADGKPIIVYFKGNEGSVSTGHARFAEMSADGYGLVAIDYRGYPMSPGEITQENILADALATYDWATQQGAPLVLWGRSLGSGPAVYVASLREAEALVLETPFTAAVDVAAERYPIIPVAQLMKDTFLSREWIADVLEPVFVAHGTSDSVISVHHGRDLFALAPDGRELFIVEGGGHGSLWGDGIWQRASAFYAATVAFSRN